MTWEWRRLNNEQLNDLYTLNSIRVIKARRIRWHVGRVGERRSAYRVFVGKPEGKRHLEDPGIDGRIILTCIFRSAMGGGGLARSGSE